MMLEFPSKAADCRQMESLLPPFVDGEVSPPDAALVEAHLERCDECRRAVAAQREVRALLASRRASLGEPAPAGLEARVRALSQQGGSANERPGRLSAFAAAAAVVLAVVGGIYWGTGRSSVLLAAQLTLDHIKCFMIDGDDHGEPLTAREAQARLHDQFGLDVQLPEPRSAAGAQLVSVRSCLYGEGMVAHVLYRIDGAPVSMFVLPGRSRSAVDVSAFGRHAEVVTGDGATYVLVGPAQLLHVAAAVGLEGE